MSAREARRPQRRLGLPPETGGRRPGHRRRACSESAPFERRNTHGPVGAPSAGLGPQETGCPQVIGKDVGSGGGLSWRPSPPCCSRGTSLGGCPLQTLRPQAVPPIPLPQPAGPGPDSTDPRPAAHGAGAKPQTHLTQEDMAAPVHSYSFSALLVHVIGVQAPGWPRVCPEPSGASAHVPSALALREQGRRPACPTARDR